VIIKLWFYFCRGINIIFLFLCYEKITLSLFWVRYIWILTDYQYTTEEKNADNTLLVKLISRTGCEEG
jgi:hypothetical protein